MTSHQQNQKDWSIDLQQQTRDAIDEMRCDPNGHLHFKHKLHGHATIEITDLLSNDFKLKSKRNLEMIHFSNIDEIINSGWCID